jgi:hypothetical protein
MNKIEVAAVFVALALAATSIMLGLVYWFAVAPTLAQ